MTSGTQSTALPRTRRGGRGERFAEVRRLPDLSARSIATRAAAAALWLIVGSSAASGFLALARVRTVEAGPPVDTPGAAKAEPAGTASPAGLEGFAELYVSAYLEGSEKAVRAFYPEAPALDAMREGDRYVARAASLYVQPRGRDAWSVTVGAEVLVAAEGGYRRDGIHYFEADVARRSDGYTATSLPGEVWGPQAP